MVEPGPLDDPGNAQGIPSRRVPVLRIFGDSSLGQKACVHIHQVWPYFYVEYPGSLNPDSGEHPDLWRAPFDHSNAKQ
jgi:DNA polymerase zeta